MVESCARYVEDLSFAHCLTLRQREGEGFRGVLARLFYSGHRLFVIRHVEVQGDGSLIFPPWRKNNDEASGSSHVAPSKEERGKGKRERESRKEIETNSRNAHVDTALGRERDAQHRCTGPLTTGSSQGCFVSELFCSLTASAGSRRVSMGQELISALRLVTENGEL